MWYPPQPPAPRYNGTQTRFVRAIVASLVIALVFWVIGPWWGLHGDIGAIGFVIAFVSPALLRGFGQKIWVMVPVVWISWWLAWTFLLMVVVEPILNEGVLANAPCARLSTSAAAVRTSTAGLSKIQLAFRDDTNVTKADLRRWRADLAAILADVQTIEFPSRADRYRANLIALITAFDQGLAALQRGNESTALEHFTTADQLGAASAGLWADARGNCFSGGYYRTFNRYGVVDTGN